MLYQWIKTSRYKYLDKIKDNNLYPLLDASQDGFVQVLYIRSVYDLETFTAV